MTNEEDWIAIRIAEAFQENALVTEAVSIKMYKLIKGELSERKLSPKDLSIIAKGLINDMAPHSSNMDQDNEN